jgi:hypothetical protein
VRIVHVYPSIHSHDYNDFCTAWAKVVGGVMQYSITSMLFYGK